MGAIVRYSIRISDRSLAWDWRKESKQHEFRGKTGRLVRIAFWLKLTKISDCWIWNWDITKRTI